MPLTDSFTLPMRVRTMEPMAELLGAEQAEVDLMYETLRGRVAQLTVCTADSELGRYERICGLPVCPALPLEERRRRVIAKQNARYPGTVAYLKDTLERLTGLRVEIRESFAAYTFQVIVHLNGRYALDLPAIRGSIRELKPAHLDFIVIPVAQVEASAMVCAEGALCAWKKFSVAVGWPAERKQAASILVSSGIPVCAFFCYGILVGWPAKRAQSIELPSRQKLAAQSRSIYEIEVCE